MNIPPEHIEVENIYAKMHLSKHRSIAITAANPQEGVTSLAIALAQRNLLSGNSTLIIDLNLHRPSFFSSLPLNEPSDSGQTIGLPQLVSDKEQNTLLMGIPAPEDRAAIMKLRKPGVLESCIKICLQHYDNVIVDTSPLNESEANDIPAERIAAACDTTLLVVLASHTREASVNQAVERLRRAGAKLGGCVINDRENPSLRSELLREIKRLEPFLGRFSRFLQRRVNRSYFLSLAD